MINKSVQDQYDTFVRYYYIGVEKFVPKRVTRKGNVKVWEPWINKETRSLCKEKQRLWYKCKASNFKSRAQLSKYKKANKLFNFKLKNSIKDFEYSLVSDKANPKRLYEYINRRQAVDVSINSIRDNNGAIVTNGIEISNILNKYFKSVFVVEDTSKLPKFKCHRDIIHKMQEFFEIPLEFVETYLLKLDQNKAPGHDKVHAHVLKACASSLALPLSLIFNNSLATGSVPYQWLTANVTPIFKKGSRLEPNNYRPVSLTSIVCKILEKFIRDIMMKHMVENNLLNEHQHGFIPNKSCTTNLLETLDYLTWNLWHRKPTDVIFLDFAKAFDTVPHSRLLLKMKGYGISEQVTNWIQAFLKNRMQRVVRGEFVSDWVEVASGVPQGSVIGPTLFILYVNDIPEMLNGLAKLYADDTKLLADVSTDVDRANLQADLSRLMNWSSDWLVMLNKGKCKVMHIGKNNPNYSYSLGNHQLDETEVERDLGVLISKDLKWASHCNKIAATANRTLGVLKRTFVSKDCTLWRKLYPTYVRPLLEFAMPAWCPYNAVDIRKIESVQRRATRIPFPGERPKYEERCHILGIDTLEVRRKRGDLIQKFKILKGLDRVEWSAEQMVIPSLYGRRSMLRREIVKGCDQRHYFFNNRVASEWNALPDSIIDATTTNIFKKELDNYNHINNNSRN